MKGTQSTLRPSEVVRSVISRSTVDTQLSPFEERSLAALERYASHITDKAKTAGVDVEYIGAHPLFSQTRVFEGPKTDWTLGPADPEALEQIVPKVQLTDLRRLKEARIDFPLIYVADEVPKGRLQSLVPVNESLPITIGREQAAAIIDPPPPPQSTLDLSDRLSRQSQQVLAVLGKALPLVGAVAVSPFVLVGAAFAALGTLDPIVIGAIPTGRPVEGAPAAWFVLARWSW